MEINLKTADPGEICFVMSENGRIIQLGIPAESNMVLQMFLANLSHSEKPFIKLPSEHDLIEKWKFDEVMEQLSKVIGVVKDIESSLFDPAHEIANFHLNGDLEPIQNFIEEYDLDSVKLAEEILTNLKKESHDK